MSTSESIRKERIKKNDQIHSTLRSLTVLLAVLFSALSTAILLIIGLPINFWWVVVFVLFVLFMLLFEYLNPSLWTLFVLVKLGIWKPFNAQDLMLYREKERTFEDGRWLDGCE